MTLLQVAEKNEKSLAENLVVIVLVALLMASFIFYFFKQQEQITRAGFESIAQVFSARITGIRAQWFMDLQPSTVNVESSQIQADGGRMVKIEVNKSGWVDTKNVSFSCQIIWQYVMETPLLYMKEPVGAVLVEYENQVVPNCQYSLSSGEYFTYHRHNGKVSEVKSAY
ncbi:MAG: competence protein ComGC [Cognaticolwellia sp.]|jgi:competence protein ComGC